MRQEQPSPRRVAVLLGHELGFCRRVLSGVLRFAGERGDWHFRDAPPDHELLPALIKWRPHGVIAHLYDRHLAGGLARIGCPVVSTTDTLSSFDFPVVDVDNLATGREAASYFLRRGFRNFGYFGSRHAHFSTQREAGFRDILEPAGFEVHTHYAEFLPKPVGLDPWRVAGNRVDQWLTNLPKPIAIFCSNDLPARRLAEACSRCHIAVPEAIALLGVDNDSSECRLASPHLSSIDTPAESIGYEAAKLLADMMAGQSKVRQPILLPPLFVATRASTDQLACEDPAVSRALKFIRDETDAAINVDAVASHVGVSRRKLERLFRDQISRSILSVIHETKTARARELLVSTELSIAEIASRVGFSNAKRLQSVFRDQTGINPGQYRLQLKIG